MLKGLDSYFIFLLLYNQRAIMTYTQYTVVAISFLKTVLSRTRPTVISVDLVTALTLSVINLMIFFLKRSEIVRFIFRNFWNLYGYN